MGLFSKKTVSESEKDRAANAFADRNKPVPQDDGGDELARRLAGGYYNKTHGAETVKPQASTATDSITLARAAMARKANDGTNAIYTNDRADKAAADAAIASRQNDISSSHIARDQIRRLTKEEQAEINRQGMDTLGNITDGIKNKQFLTEVDESLDGIRKGKVAEENLTDAEVNQATARFRNVGFFTETESSGAKRMTADEKLEQDIEEVEAADKAITSFTNVGFRNKKVEEDADMSEKIEEEGEGGK